MLKFSSVFRPEPVKRGDVFEAYRYPHAEFAQLADPVLNIDRFRMSGPTFPEHPHAGFSAVTWLLPESQNALRNRDNLGHDLEIKPGSLHWTRASSGVVHEETPLPDGGDALGLQVFVNLPAHAQQDSPDVFHVEAETTHSKVISEGVSRRVMVDGNGVGEAADALPAPVRFVELTLEPNRQHRESIPSQFGGLILAMSGSIDLGIEAELSDGAAVAVSADDDGGELFPRAGNEGARLIFILGERLQQPIHEQGPFVMASEETLVARTQAFKKGTFGSLAQPLSA